MNKGVIFVVWGIIGALDREVELIQKRMSIQKKEIRFGCEYHIGTINDVSTVVVCSGIGKVNAAVCAQTIICEFGATVVVNVGVAGNTCKDLKVLDVVISNELVFHDVDLSLFERYYPFKREFTADAVLVSLCEAVLKNMTDRSFDYRIGRIATGDVFVNDPATRDDIVSRLSPLCVEMEGASIGQVASMNNIPFVVIRSMSDNADESADETYDNWLEKAAEHSASIVIGMIEREL